MGSAMRVGALRAAAVGMAGMLAACAEMPTPAPLFTPGSEAGSAGAAPIIAAPAIRPRPSAEGRHIVVRPGQSLSRIAAEYHVSEHAIIAANHLHPPYTIEIGQRLLIPGGGARAPERLATARPLPHPERGSPEVIPLDTPPPPARAAAGAASPTAPSPASAPAPRAAAAEAKPAEPAASEHAAALPHGGQLPWPVHGKVLTGYGAEGDGKHNAGINIAAPRGAPVKAVEGGVVAYAGNELRGYGNLVLIKHPDGLISAYAHCEELLVKRGDKVTPGEVIAKVGATGGGVGEPQLHFELRRGEHAVDPRQFLAPGPSAAAQRPGGA